MISFFADLQVVKRNLRPCSLFTPDSGHDQRADGHRQAQCARSAIDSAATILVDPGATPREVVAAHSFLGEALALDGRPNTCGVESIDTVREASTLPPEDQKWLQNYLASRLPTTQQSSATADLGIAPVAKITLPWRLESRWRS